VCIFQRDVPLTIPIASLVSPPCPPLVSFQIISRVFFPLTDPLPSSESSTVFLFHFFSILLETTSFSRGFSFLSLSSPAVCPRFLFAATQYLMWSFPLFVMQFRPRTDFRISVSIAWHFYTHKMIGLWLNALRHIVLRLPLFYI